jgi:predicted nucleic acid-binding protein
VIVVDSGVLIAATDVDDNHHESCARLIAERGSEFRVPATVVVEVCWMSSRHVSVILEGDLLDAIAEGELQLEVLEQIDYARMSELVTTYADLPLGMVDASVVAIAERLDVREIATIDRRHFSVVRPRHVDAFTLPP